MTTDDLDAIEARARAALTYERSVLDEDEGVWVQPAAENEDSAGWFGCPLCDGEGQIEGQRYDDKGEHAATVVAYGIGKGLSLAEEWVENAPADILALVAEVRQLRQALSITCEREPTKREGDAYEDKQDVSMGPSYPTGECFVARGGWTGRRCRRCTEWVWGGPTACLRCVAEEERDEARAEVEREKASATRGWQTADELHLTVRDLKAEVERLQERLGDRAEVDSGRLSAAFTEGTLAAGDAMRSHIPAAYQRGAEAMREAAAKTFECNGEGGCFAGRWADKPCLSCGRATDVRALPLPEEKL